MLKDREIKWSSYVLALLLGIVAYNDVTNGLGLMESGAGAGWVVDLMTAGVCAALVALLLTRPHLYFFFTVAVWALVAFMANFIMKQAHGDDMAIGRMAIYWPAFIIATVMVIIEGWPWLNERMAKRATAAGPWAGGPWQGQYPPGYPAPQYAPPPGYVPPAPPAPPAAPPAPPAARKK